MLISPISKRINVLISNLSFCYKVLIWSPLVITKISAYIWLLWYIMTVNISVVGKENGVPVLTDEIDSSRHCIHNSNNVWHILHYLFRKRNILSAILFILALIYKLSLLHCTLQIICGGHWVTNVQWWYNFKVYLNIGDIKECNVMSLLLTIY